MTKAPFAKALTKHSYQLGCPPKLIIPVYLIAVFVFIITDFKFFYLLFPAVGWHIWAKAKLEKDEYFVDYFLDYLKEEPELEP